MNTFILENDSMLKYVKGLGEIDSKTIFTFPLPERLRIEPTNHCNLNCKFCFHSNGRITRPKGFMSFGSFQKIIDDLSGFKPKVNLYHSGEPFLNKDLFNFIIYARSAGLDVTVTTNGTLLNKDDFGILDTGINTLSISLSGVDEEDYNNVRSNNGYQKIKHNISILASRKIEKEIDLKLWVNAIETKQNHEKIKEFKENFEAIEGLDGVDIRSLTDWGGQVDLEQIAPQKVDKVPFLNLKRINGKIFNLGYCGPVHTDACILWDGTVIPCCADFNGGCSLGNIFETPFTDIWKGEKINRLKYILKSPTLTKKHPVCSHCRGLSNYSGTNISYMMV